MNYNETAKIFTVVEVDDGMGGFIRERVLVAEIKCKVAPYTVKTIDSAGLPFIHSMNKLFTQNKTFISDIYSEYLIEYKGVVYRKKALMDANKCLIIEIERIFEVIPEQTPTPPTP